MPAPEVNESRQREHVAAETQRGRRRRRNGTLNRMTQMRLDIVPAEDLDLENYVYRWVNDEDSKLFEATHGDDYDFVTTQELGRNFVAREDSESESDNRVRKVVATNKNGHPIYTFLCKKPREYHEADYNEVVEAREAMMEGRVYHGQVDSDPKEAALGGLAYVPKGVQIGHAAQRRKTPVARTLSGKV